jgi:hypothetical protein
VNIIRTVVACAIIAVWGFVAYSATLRPELIGLATVVSPPMLIAAGYLFGMSAQRVVKKALESLSDDDRGTQKASDNNG